MESTDHSPRVDALLQAALDDLEALTDRVVAAIRSQAKAFATFPYERHRADSVLSLNTILVGLKNGVGPTQAALDHAASIGRNRAQFGVPLIDAIEGYHVAAAEIWSYLLERATAQGPEVVADLSAEVSPLWTTMNRVSTSFTTAHSLETARLTAGQHQLRSRLVALLREGGSRSGLGDTLATSLGFEATGTYVVLATQRTSPSVVDVVNEHLESMPGKAHCVLDDEARAIVVSQGVDSATVGRMLRELSGRRVGIGMPRTGLSGAAMSLTDADLAIAASSDAHPVVSFEDEWAAAIFASEAERVEPLIRLGIEAARANPHLAEAVTEFSAQRFSLTSAAAALHVHPNTTKYRLSRWEELTGWDVFTAEGLIASLVAIRFAQAPPS